MCPLLFCAYCLHITQWPLACWDCGFKSHQGHGCLSVVSVVCYQVEFSASGWSIVQRSPTKCGVSNECEAPQEETVTRNQVKAPQENKSTYYYLVWYFIKKGKMPLHCIINKIGYVYVVVIIKGFLYIWFIVDKR